MPDAPPLKKRPSWNVETTVVPNAKRVRLDGRVVLTRRIRELILGDLLRRSEQSGAGGDGDCRRRSALRRRRRRCEPARRHDASCVCFDMGNLLGACGWFEA
jgi:hypothetical protein